MLGAARLSGTMPFNGDTDEQMFDAIIVGRYDFPDEDWADVSPTAKSELKLNGSTCFAREVLVRYTAADGVNYCIRLGWVLVLSCVVCWITLIKPQRLYYKRVR